MSSKKATQTQTELPPGSTVTDIHICGQCWSQFTSIPTFSEHKRAGCAPVHASHNSASIPPLDAVSTPSPSDQGKILRRSLRSNKRRWQTSNGSQELQPQIAADAEISSVSESPNQNSDNATLSPPSQGADGVVESSSVVSVQDKASGNKKTLPTPTQMMQSPQQQTSKSRTEKRYKCNNDGCSFTTAHLKDIQRHVRIHTGEKPYACTYCKKCFSRQDKLKIHHRIHIGDKPFQCSKCEYSCVDGGSMKKHMRIHNDERPFKCQICDYRSRNSSQLIVHLRTHTGDTPFHCQQCDSKFKINSDLTRHMRTHTGIKPYHCKECDYKSTLKSNLNSHMRTNHSNEKRYQCEECGFACCTKRQQKQHSHTHATEKPIKCLECNFTCYNKAVFRRHERKHSDDRPYKCKYCNFDSKYPGHVPAHVRKQHPDKVKIRPNRNRRSKRKTPPPNTDGGLQVVSKKPFQCDSCEATFVRQDSLFSHRRQHVRLHNETRDRESMAYAVLQLQQYSGKGAPENDQSIGDKDAADGVTPEKPADDLHTLLSAIESSQSNEMSVVQESSCESSSSATEASRNNEALRHSLPERIEGPMLSNRQTVASTTQSAPTIEMQMGKPGSGDQASDVLEVIQIATDALREVEVSSESHQDGSKNNDMPSSVVIVQPGSQTDPNPHTITVEFQQQEIVLTQIPSTTSIPKTSDSVAIVQSTATMGKQSTSTSESGEKSSLPSSPSCDSTTYFQLAPQEPVPVATSAASVVSNQREPTPDNLSLQVTGAVPQQVFNVQIPSQFLTQHASGNIVQTQQQPMQLSTSQLQVLPVQTVTNATPKLVNFAQPIAVAQPSTILIQQQQPLQQQQQGNANVQVTYTMQSPARPSQTQSQANWQSVQYGPPQQTLVAQPVQSVYQQQIPMPVMTLTVPQQQQQQQQRQLQPAGTSLQQVTLTQPTVAVVPSSPVIQQRPQQQQQPQPIAIRPAQIQPSSSTAGANAKDGQEQ